MRSCPSTQPVVVNWTNCFFLIQDSRSFNVPKKYRDLLVLDLLVFACLPFSGTVSHSQTPRRTCSLQVHAQLPMSGGPWIEAATFPCPGLALLLAQQAAEHSKFHLDCARPPHPSAGGQTAPQAPVPAESGTRLAKAPLQGTTHEAQGHQKQEEARGMANHLLVALT